MRHDPIWTTAPDHMRRAERRSACIYGGVHRRPLELSGALPRAGVSKAELSPDAFWFRHAQAASAADAHVEAVESATHYLTTAARRSRTTEPRKTPLLPPDMCTPLPGRWPRLHRIPTLGNDLDAELESAEKLALEHAESPPKSGSPYQRLFQTVARRLDSSCPPGCCSGTLTENWGSGVVAPDGRLTGGKDVRTQGVSVRATRKPTPLPRKSVTSTLRTAARRTLGS